MGRRKGESLGEISLQITNLQESVHGMDKKLDKYVAQSERNDVTLDRVVKDVEKLDGRVWAAVFFAISAITGLGKMAFDFFTGK